MRFLRKKRAAVVAAAVATVGAVTLLVVLPALASTPGDQVPPPSGAGVTPVDVGVGGNGTCSNLFPASPMSSGVSEYDNPNPQTASDLQSGNNDGVSFTLSASGNPKHQLLDVSATNAVILGIGVNGGSDTTVYDYRPSGVPADTGLHAPASKYSGVVNGVEQNITQYYGISHLTVCYEPVLSLSGTVYNDLNQSGTQDSGDLPLSGWTVTLYKTTSTSTSTASSDNTGATGSYSFSVPYDKSATYTVCEAPPSGTWVQTTPTASTAVCSSAGGSVLPNGYTVTSTPTQPLDFGNIKGYICSGSSSDPLGPTSGPSTYQIGSCKSGDTYTFPVGTVPAGTTTTGGVDIGGSPYIGYSTIGSNSAIVPTIEHLVIPDPYNGTQPEYTHVLYTSGTDLSSLALMPYCNFDPRSDPSTSLYGLASPYGDSPPNAADTGPSGVIPGTDTACVISLTTSAPAAAGGTGTLEAWVYALDDATRAFN